MYMQGFMLSDMFHELTYTFMYTVYMYNVAIEATLKIHKIHVLNISF